MLVLTRKVDQGIVIAGNIYIRVLGVERDRVKIGIAAPKEIVVLRQELVDRENAKAGKDATGTGNEKSEVPSAANAPDSALKER
ncbi:MAG: carbon storage regulator [Chloroflexi bacterium]|nr:carbon storage regulator [Chloroflexota bacterium]MCI0855628.1 carbon storage regulator [Chloroflexota bacterium]MCI0889188.1 carbon storage regulator [Chloroflexota bacterium]